VNSALLTATTVLIVLAARRWPDMPWPAGRIRAQSAIIIYFMVAMTVPIQLFPVPAVCPASRKTAPARQRLRVGAVIAAMNMPLSVFLNAHVLPQRAG